MKKPLSILTLVLAFALSAPAMARPVKWKKTTPVTDDTLDAALARAKATALAEYEAMERARARVGSKAWDEYKAMEEARAKAAKPTPRRPH